jgi:hypothetical protein
VLWSAQRVAGISRDSAAIATLLVGATAAFQFSASVIRNDMLPTMLSAMAIGLTLLALHHCRPRFWFAAGLLFGLAIAAKLSFGPIALAVGLFAIFSGGRCGLRAASWLAAGGAVGILPMLLIWTIAPDAFGYGVLTFGATGPFAWYTANGAGNELTLLEKMSDLLLYLVRGPALVALLILAGNWYATRHRVRSPGRRLAIWMVAGGLIGAALPTPSQLQYVMPLIPPLALALGYFLDDAKHRSFSARQTILGVLSLAAIPGLVEVSRDVAAMAFNGSPVLETTDAAHWVGGTVRAMTPWDRGDTVATLSAHQIIDSGLQLDPRFAAGPFVYRTGWTLTQAQARQVKTMIPANLGDMDRDPPDAILVGYEAGTRKLPLSPDKGLIAYARARAYRMIAMPDGIGRLYVRVRKALPVIAKSIAVAPHRRLNRHRLPYRPIPR